MIRASPAPRILFSSRPTASSGGPDVKSREMEEALHRSSTGAGANPRGIVIIGVGNELRSDDALGILLARELRWLVPSGVRVLEASGEGAALIDLWSGATDLILIDAVRSTAAPGTLHEVDLSVENIPRSVGARSSHAFGVAEAVATARELGLLPPHVRLFGVEGENFSPGTEVSSSVRSRFDDVVHDVLALLPAA
jgi:hydrogenase maturation protease